MASNYKTPGVYVEEIVKFPPSIAQVETAIPAFIGYTEKAIEKEAGDLDKKPKRITSLLEYETYFGSAKKETDIKVTVQDGIINVKAPSVDKKSPFLMYYSLQLYFANGGGPCYIVSVGQYDSSIASPATLVSFNNLNDGLKKIRKVDEPTLILFPDATSLSSDADFYAIYNNALTQCNELQDRFTIIDTYSDLKHSTSLSDSEGNAYNTLDPDDAIRNGLSLGKDYLKYGAVYYPFLETILDYIYDESQIDVTISASSSDSLKKQIQKVSDAISTTKLDSLISDIDTLETSVDNAADDSAAIAFISKIQEKIKGIQSYLNGLITSLNSVIDLAKTDTIVSSETNTLDTWITDVLEVAVLGLSKAIDRLNNDDSKVKVQKEIANDTTNDPALRRVLGIHNDDTSNNALKSKIESLTTSGGALFALIAALPASGSSAPTPVKLDKLATKNNALYNKIKNEIGLKPIKLPPSSAMAGIYAKVDASRGVWKAPANIGLNYVMKPSVPVSHEDQRDLNVDTVAGKSINAIRTFTGKGILVWGARTLAGNDKEWRYISVRRFFNMAEESIKKGTEQFVFEPNDANTWVLVKAMISNFLTLQWRAGALAGPTPDKAFYVKVGLGETMTANDILDGYMIIEIGMAVVRPAEFIILKFSHKMQEA